MMMAHDSLSQEPALETDTIASLEAALRGYLGGNGSIDDVEPALRVVAAEARRKQMHAEQLLVVLKDVWYALPGLDGAQDGTQNASLQRVVSCCIRAYYTS